METLYSKKKKKILYVLQEYIFFVKSLCSNLCTSVHKPSKQKFIIENAFRNLDIFSRKEKVKIFLRV